VVASGARSRATVSDAGPARAISRRLGYHVTVFDQDPRAGGMIWSQIPRFRLPMEVIDEEVGYILDLGVEFRGV